MLGRTFASLIAAAIMLSSFLPISAEAAFRTCSSLFVSFATGFSSETAKRLQPSAQEFRKQFEQGVPYEKMTLTITPAIRETLKYMSAHLDVVESGSVHTHLNRSGLLTDRYQKLLARIQAVEQADVIGYFEYFQIAEQFSILSTAALVNRKPEDFDVSAQIVRLEGLLNQTKERSTLKIAENRSEWLFLPLITDVGVPTMNELQAMGIAVVGVTVKKSYVDAQEFLPDQFFYHDFAHAFNYERQPFRSSGLIGWAAGGPRLPSQSFSSRLEFFRAFRDDMARNFVTPRAALIRENLWFLAFHEAGFPMHSTNLLSELNRFENYFGPIFKRLTNVKDLGYAFRDQPLSEQEVRTEIANVRQFANSVKGRF